MNRCVNTNDPRFKETAQRFNISEAKLEFIAHKYINAHEDKDFPDDAYIQEAIREKKYSVTKEQHDVLMRAWEMMNPVLSMEKFDSIQDIYAYIERLNWDKWVSYFPVNVTTTADGKYRATLSKPEFAIMGSPQKGKKPIVYNKEQEAAIQQAVAHIEAVRTGKSKQQFFTIRGKAGTGKTTIVNEILRRAPLGSSWSTPVVVIGALSNKATTVIQQKIDDDVKKNYYVQFKSIAGMLAKRRNNDGSFTRDPKKIPAIKGATLVVIDEASMIGEEDYEEIKELLKNSRTAVIFLGDSGQLPPVRKGPYYSRHKISSEALSPVFADKSIPEVSLVTRVRQGESSPVLDYADEYWEFSHEMREEYPNDLDKTSKVTDEGALIVQRGEIDLVKQLLPLFEEAKRTKNPNLVKIVPYTNNSTDNRESAVDRYNRLIRKALYPDSNSESFEVGDLVVFNDAFGQEENAIQNSTEGVIEAIHEAESYDPPIPGIEFKPVERVYATIKTDTGTIDVPVLVPSLKNRKAFQSNLSAIGNYARNVDKKAWRIFWEYHDTYAANLGYAYAIDSHKSQGSTYEVVAVDAVDINGVGPTTLKTKAQSIYTALTRASNVTIVSTNTTNENIIFTDIKGINDRIKSVKAGTATEETYTPKTVEEYFPEVTEEDIPDLIQDPNRKSKPKTKKKKMADLGLDEDDLNDPRLRGTFNDNDDAKPKKWNAGPEEDEDSDEDAERKVEEEEEEPSNPQQRAYDRFVQVQSSASIKFSPKNHSYTVNGEKADYSVTTFKTFYLDNEEFEGDYKELSSRIGTSHDAVLRDFFAGESAKEYPNLSLFQVKRLRKQAQRLKNRLESQYLGAMYITDEDLLRVAARVEYNGENYLVAGTMDMVLVTKEGNLVIVDFKTKRANSDGGKLSNATKEEYAIQTALYKAFVDVSSAAENEVLETLIAKFNVEYESPKKATYTFKKDQILVEVDGEYTEIQEATDLYTPGIFDELLGFTAELDDITVSPVKTSLQRRKESKKVAEENRTTPKEFTGEMKYFFNGEGRKEIKAKSTLGAILEGKRTATTRFGTEDNEKIEYWRGVKKGDIIVFHDDYGNKVRVRVTVPLHRLAKDTDAEEWSKKEGWSVGHFNRVVKPKIKKGTAWQMEYELAEEKKAKQAPKKIEINSYNEKYALLSNLGNKPFEIDGKTFKSVEHYFGWCKAVSVEDFAIANRILKAATGKQAKLLHSHKLRMTKEQIKKWDSYSAKVMEKGMRAAFEQNEDAKDLLLSTGDALLTHKYGGPFAEILMKLREEYGGSGRPESEKKARTEAKEAYAESKKVPKPVNMRGISKVISGGQTGVDTLGLVIAKELGIETGGTITPGFVREKDVDEYTREDLENLGLQEISKQKQKGKRGKEFYLPRTEANVEDSDGTVYFEFSGDPAGKNATKRFAIKHQKPFLLNPTAEQLKEWIEDNDIRTLNVAGNRGSKLLENREKVIEVLKEALEASKAKKTETNLHLEKKDDRYTHKDSSEVEAFNTASEQLRKQGWHVEFYTKKSKDGSLTNNVMTISIEGRANKGFFELVKDAEEDYYSVHFKTKSKKADNVSDFAEEALTDNQKENMFKALIFAIPEGGIVSTWGQLTQGGVHALESLADRSGGVLSRYGERLLEDKDSNKISVPVYKKLTEDELIDKKLSAVRRARKEEKQEVKVNFSSPHFKVEKVDRDHEGYTGEFAITPEVVDLETLSSDVIEQEINDLLAVLPYSSIISLDYLDVNDNFAYILDTLTRHPLVYATESDKQIKIDPHSSTGYMLSDYARTNRRLMWDAEKGILRMPVFTFGKTKSEIEERAQMNKLLNNPLLTQEELRHLSTATIYKLSEIITHINTYKNGYDLYFGERQKGDKYYDTDFTQMSRIDIIRELGLTSLFDIVKERIFDSEKAASSLSRKTKKKMNIVHDNWKAFIKLGYDSLIGLEEIALNGDDKIKNELNDVADEEGSEDQDIVEELFGSSPEHWQVGFRQVSTFSSLSTMIKRVLYGMYQLAEDGDIVYSEFGLENRINPQEAVSKILHFTQGALSLDAKDENEKLYPHSMLAMLKEHLNEEPWLQQIIELLEGKYENGELVKPADEQFKSQFYTNFQKYFQTYAVTVKDGKGNVNIKIINENAQADNIYNEVKAKENAFALGYFKMKNKDGSLNKENVKALREATKKLDDILAEASGKGRKKMSDRGIDLDEYHAVIKEIADLLDIPVAEDSLYTVFNSKSNADKLSQKLFYLNEALKEDVKEVTKLREFKQIVEVMTKNTGMEMESVSYEAGKLYYSFVLPNYLSRLVNKLKQGGMSDTEYQRFLENEYLKYPWFRKNGKIRNHWLKRLSKSKELRANLTHTTSLHFLGTSYIDKSPVEYIASMMRMYFYDNNGKWAYFRIPTLSNKPSEEYLKFERITTAYRDTITDLMLDVFFQELDRIQAVRKRQNNTTKDQKIENFDTKGLEFVLESYLQKYLDGTYSERPEYEELSKAEKQEEERFSELLNKKLDGKMENDSQDYIDLMLLFKTMTKRGMDENYTIQRQQWIDEGFINLDENDKIEKVFNDMKLSEDDLKEYFWNDAFATMQILELTITDPAYYKHGEDLQKRLAQLHSTGTQANIYARDNSGNLYTKDGIERTIYIKDNKVKSTSLKNLMKVADQILEATPAAQKAKVRAQLQDIIKSFSKINWADAQGYSCPSSFRKKMGVFGKWGIREQQAYDMLMDKEKYPDASIADILDVLWQPIKPFVYSQISKPGYNDILPTLKVGVQNKNSEYTLMIADALMRRGGMTNKLQAIFDFMEESQHTGNELNGEGIDTIQFESTVKTGKCGVIDLNDTVDEEGNVVSLSAEEVKDRLRKAYTVEDNKIVYNQDYVHEIPFEDYMIQQEVPAHFKGHAQAQGSQNRILIFADQPNVDPITGETNYLIIDGKKVSVEKAKEDYFNAIADNINESMQELVRKFKLEGYDTRATNVAISRILKEEILKDSRYGSDLLWACDTNELGEFNIPLSDPTQSNRIQQLLNSIIKNRINKQEIAGGPIVQVSSWGVSDQLNIRFKTQPDENNEYKLLLTETEFNHDIFPEDYDTKFKSKDGYVDYDSYIADQYGVAYMEAYLPIQDESIVKDFLTKDAEGNEYIDVAKMEKVQPDLLYAVGYRIPTESKYSMAPIKIKGFLPVNSGEGIMLPAEITTMSGSDFDIDKMYIMRYTFIRKKGENGEFVYEKPTKGKGYRDNLIISTQLAVLQSKEVQKQLFTPGNFDEPKHLGYLVDYVQTMCSRYGFEPDEVYEEADKMDTEKLKDAISDTKNLVFAYTQVQFHKQNMVAGKLIGVFAQANVSHAFMSLVEDTPLYIPLDNSFTLNGYKVGGDTPFNIDSMYTLDGSALISSNLAALLAASVDAVKDPVLNLININMDTVNTVTSLLRMGFNMSTVSLLCSQPIIRDVVREAAIRSANNEWGTNLYTVISEYIDKIAKDAVKSAEYDVRDIKDIRISDQDLINNLNGKDTITNYMVLNIFLRMQEINDAFKDITHMTRYNSISSAVGPFASDTMLSRIKDMAFESNPLIGSKIMDACKNHPVLQAFRECANLVERRLLGANLIQAGTQYENALTRLGKVLGYDRGVPSKVANKFTDFFMSFYVNANPTGSVFDLSYEHRKDMLQNFPIEFLRLKPRYIDNALISSIQYEETDREQFGVLTLKTRGMSNEALENLKQAWVSLYDDPNTTNLAIRLVEYCFFRGSFGFNPKTFTSLIPNKIKDEGLFNYTTTLNKRASNVESGELNEQIILQFILHNDNLITDRFTGLDEFAPSLISHEEYGNCILCEFKSQKDENKKLSTNKPLLMIDNKAYYVVEKNTEGIVLKEVDLLGGDGQGFEISVEEKFPTTVFDPDFRPTNQHAKKEKRDDSKGGFLSKETIGILIDQLIDEDQLEGLYAKKAIDLINVALEERGFDFRIYASTKNKKLVGKALEDIEGVDNPHEVLNKGEKTVEDLNLC